MTAKVCVENIADRFPLDAKPCKRVGLMVLLLMFFNVPYGSSLSLDGNIN